jgi:hypothetical protein
MSTLLLREDQAQEAKPGDRVRLHSSDWVVTITQAGIDCDCGKGILCPLNPQERI